MKGAGSLRIGFEDSAYLDVDRIVETNAPIVKRAADLVRECNREVASVKEARQMLGL